MSSTKQESDLLIVGNVVKNRWEVLKKLGGGGFGEIYECLDFSNQQKVALKLESSRISKQLFKMEVAVLQKLQGTIHVCSLFSYGRNEKFNFIAMTLQGKNLAELRRSQKNAVFSLSTMLLLSSQILQSIEDVHMCGFLHRDIKPSNFAIGRLPSTSRTVFILDFGLARQFIKSDGNGEIRPPRSVAGFRGTIRYASMNAHQNREMGRHDDLWSTLYMLVEMITGSLPWRKYKERNQVGQMKQSCDYGQLLRYMPSEFKLFLSHIQSLTYFDVPDYAYLKSLISQCMHRKNICQSDMLDWESMEEYNFFIQSRTNLTRNYCYNFPKKTFSNTVASIKNLDKIKSLENNVPKLKGDLLLSNEKNESTQKSPVRLNSSVKSNDKCVSNQLKNTESKENKGVKHCVTESDKCRTNIKQESVNYRYKSKSQMLLKSKSACTSFNHLDTPKRDGKRFLSMNIKNQGVKSSESLFVRLNRKFSFMNIIKDKVPSKKHVITSTKDNIDKQKSNIQFASMKENKDQKECSKRFIKKSYTSKSNECQELKSPSKSKPARSTCDQSHSRLFSVNYKRSAGSSATKAIKEDKNNTYDSTKLVYLTSNVDDYVCEDQDMSENFNDDFEKDQPSLRKSLSKHSSDKMAKTKESQHSSSFRSNERSLQNLHSKSAKSENPEFIKSKVAKSISNNNNSKVKISLSCHNSNDLSKSTKENVFHSNNIADKVFERRCMKSSSVNSIHTTNPVVPKYINSKSFCKKNHAPLIRKSMQALDTINKAPRECSVSNNHTTCKRLISSFKKDVQKAPYKVNESQL